MGSLEYSHPSIHGTSFCGPSVRKFDSEVVSRQNHKTSKQEVKQCAFIDIYNHKAI
jgi:hypothetical protein